MRIKINIFVNRVIEILLAFLFISNMSDSLFSPIFAIFVTKTIPGATLRTVGFSVAIYAVAKSIFQLPIAKKIDKTDGEIDDFYVMMVGSVASIIYSLGLISVGSTSGLYILSIINGIGAACLMAAYYGTFSRHADKGYEGFEWSLFSVVGLTLSAAVGGAVGGILADAIGFKNTLLIAAALQFFATITLVFIYPLLSKRERKTPFPKIPMP